MEVAGRSFCGWHDGGRDDEEGYLELSEGVRATAFHIALTTSRCSRCRRLYIPNIELLIYFSMHMRLISTDSYYRWSLNGVTFCYAAERS